MYLAAFGVRAMPSARERRVLLRDWFDTNVLSEESQVNSRRDRAPEVCVRGIRQGWIGYRSHPFADDPLAAALGNLASGQRKSYHGRLLPPESPWRRRRTPGSRHPSAGFATSAAAPH